ncbi:MAG TPA: NAD-dependent succinate-semialdehyde dehydrogenase [Candidatus Saccharimonadales bacterium]|nr:NAD-dependent succinate-semialdehyde dehydrogenase [Candidatus Saccharimonadales bacterium]
MALRSINPASEEVIQEFDELSDQQIDQKLAAAQAAFEKWRETSFDERAKLMRRAAEVLRAQKSDLAAIMTSEMGKTISAAGAEVEKCAATCDYYADNAAKFLAPEKIVTDAAESYARFDPLGVVLAVMPWNFPFWQVFRFAVPALMAGNTGVLKHASNVQLSGQAIEKIFREAGFPEGAFANLEIGSAKVDAIIRDRRVKAVTLTGSEYAGSQVAKTAGEMIKKTVLELGGSDPFIVLADADLDAAAKTAAATRLQFNAGQSCISAKRFIVETAVAEEFTAKLKAAIEQEVIGDPTKPETTVGPLVNEQAVKDIDRQVQESIKKGAKLVCGGQRPAGKGYFYTPAVLTNITKDMPVFAEEVFGPVLPIIPVKDAAQAVRVANDSPYGLASTIFSNDQAAAQKLAQQLEAGAVFINGQVKSDPRLPFGGIKQSGYGRELSHYGIKEFVNIKTVWVK